MKTHEKDHLYVEIDVLCLNVCAVPSEHGSICLGDGGIRICNIGSKVVRSAGTVGCVHNIIGQYLYKSTLASGHSCKNKS